MMITHTNASASTLVPAIRRLQLRTVQPMVRQQQMCELQVAVVHMPRSQTHNSSGCVRRCSNVHVRGPFSGIPANVSSGHSLGLSLFQVQTPLVHADKHAIVECCGFSLGGDG